MSGSPTVFVLLPAYNEERSLARLIPDILQTLQTQDISFRICLVDDGSSDGTAKLAASWVEKRIVLYLPHEKNQGYGAALRTGFLWIVQHAKPEDIAVSLDADTTHSPDYIPVLARKMNEGYDVVTASYSMPGGKAFGVPWKRRWMSAIVNQIFRWRYRVPETSAYTNGFRAYRVAALQLAYQQYGESMIEETGFPGGTELFLKVFRRGVRVGQIPFDLHYERRGGQSKIRILRTILSYLRLWILIQ